MSAHEKTEQARSALEQALRKLLRGVGKVRIGNRKQFPYGWRKAAKGRTVWRLLEELITQNLEANSGEYGFDTVLPAGSEVDVYDFTCRLKGVASDLFVNVKSAVRGAHANKDDISKAVGLLDFFRADPRAELFVASFFIDFNDDMTIELVDCVVVPVGWIPDIYVNPSNNGNLQSSKYKDAAACVKRSNRQFVEALEQEVAVAAGKKRKVRAGA